MAKKYPKQYIPKGLSAAEKKKQRAELDKSTKAYEEGRYVKRNKIKGFCLNSLKLISKPTPKPKIRFFIGNTQTGGYGITLTEASTVIYYSNNYDLEKRLQSEDRAHRIGQKNKVLYIDMVAKGTVDDKIIKSLRNKVNIAKEISGEELSTWI